MIRKSFPLVFTALALWACTPTVDVRGNQPAPEALAQVKVGETSEEQVQLLLGSPSSVLTYGDETWHYVYQKVSTVSFFTPKVIDYSTVSIVFDSNGKVKDISKVGLKDTKSIGLVSRETPTAGKELSVIEQLIGNVGKFSKDTKGK